MVYMSNVINKVLGLSFHNGFLKKELIFYVTELNLILYPVQSDCSNGLIHFNLILL